MTENDIARMENTFGIKLPQIYRDWALRLRSPEEELELDGDWAFADVDELIEENHSLLASESNDAPWPANLFCIGVFQLNHYLIDVDDPAKGVFYVPFWEEFDPNEHHFGSLEEFCAEKDEKPSFPGFHGAWRLGCRADGSLTIEQLEDCSLESIEAEVRQLDGSARAEVALTVEPSSLAFIRPPFRIGGSEAGCYIQAVRGSEIFNFCDPKASPELLPFLPMLPHEKVSGQLFCRDRALAIEVLRHFYTTGDLLPEVEWRRQIEPAIGLPTISECVVRLEE